MKTKLQNWSVTGYWPYNPVLMNSMETGIRLSPITDSMATENVGSVYTILENAGEIENIYFAKNSRNCEWVANRWWVFEKKLLIDESKKDKRLRLIIEGIDYEADIHINKKLVCTHIGPFIPLVIELNDYISFGEENVLTITLHSAPEEHEQVGYTSETSTQRSRFDYHWDFSTRMVGIGVYGPIYLEESGEAIIEDAFVKPKYIKDDIWQIPNDLEIDSKINTSASLKAELIYNGEAVVLNETEISLKEGSNLISAPFEVLSPDLWYPNGHGKQPLYQLNLSLIINGEISHSKETTIAFRDIKYSRAQSSREDSLPYLPVINGKEIYIKGVNLVPFDLAKKFPSKEVYDEAIQMIKNANMNFVRVWGGGVLESEYFYKLCDKNGIMVWQDFIQSSSGIDNSPSTDPEFLELLRINSAAMIKARRNHASLCFYCGGNELYIKEDINGNPIKERPVSYEHPNIALLKELADNLDKDTLLIPTTASGPNISFNEQDLGGNHDNHGPWMYEGVEKHYEFFNINDCILHGEFGCNGMSDMKTLKSFLPADKLKVFKPLSDHTWNLHGGVWWDTTERDSEIFGKFEENELEKLIKCSQFIQAEGLRYALQSNLRRAMKNCGSIIWQFSEPWPNVSGTCLTSYPLIPKLAYYFTKDSYAESYASLKYNKLCYFAGEKFSAEVFAFNETEEKSGTVHFEITEIDGKILLEKDFSAKTFLSTSVSEISFDIPADMQKGFKVKTYWQEENALINEYLFLIKDNKTAFCDKETVINYVDGYMKNKAFSK